MLENNGANAKAHLLSMPNMVAFGDHFVRDRHDSIISRSHNLRGIRDRLSRFPARLVKISRTKERAGGGRLRIEFEDGSYYETIFASYTVLLGALRYWRKLYGVPLYIDRRQAGIVNYQNPWLLENRVTQAGVAMRYEDDRLPEKIATAAWSYHGNIYQGTDHYSAFLNAWDAAAFPDCDFIEDAYDKIHANGKDGFVTTQGRFVDRDEAHQIALAARQYYDKPFDMAAYKEGWLDAGNLSVAEALADDPKNELLRLPDYGTDFWVFTLYELKNPSLCKATDEFVAPISDDDNALGVIVLRTGEVTNRYEDGTIGVTRRDLDLADSAQSYIKSEPAHNDFGMDDDVYAEHWRQVIVNNKGGFIDFKRKRQWRH